MNQTNLRYKTSYIRIDSENSTQKDSTGDFWVHLKDPIRLEQEAKVALVDIIFPHTIHNVKKSLSQQRVRIIRNQLLSDSNNK